MSWKITPSYTPADEYFQNVSLLVHGNGTNGSTTITDSSPTPKTVTAFGNAQISTAQSNFGGSSIAFDGSGDYLTVPPSTDFDIQSSDYTAETWFYLTGNPGVSSGFYRSSLFGNYSSSTSGWNLQLRGNATGFTSISVGDGDITLLDVNTSISKNAWHHVAVVKSGSTITCFFNGLSIGSGSRQTFFAASSNLFRIGRLLDSIPGWDFPGYIDDLRITKGVARYTANFTPPTAPFPDI